MTQDVYDWLPDGAFTDDTVKAALAGVIDAWAEAWILVRSISVSRIRTGRGKTLAPPDNLRLQGDLAIVDVLESGKRRLLEAALDVQLSGKVLLENDRAVLDRFVSRILEDLIGRFDPAFGKLVNGERARLGFTLSLSGEDILSATIPHHALVKVIKTGFGGSRRARIAPRPRQKALGPTQVEVRGLLGHAELAVDDLKGLAHGDVLILDRALHEIIELRLSGNDRAIGRGRLGRKDGRVSIQF